MPQPLRFTLDGRSATPHFPGIGRYVRSLAAALPPLLTPDEQLHLLTSENTAVSPFSLSQQWHIPPLLRSSALYHSPYYLMPYRPGVPTVLTVYDLIPQHFPELVSARARLLFRLTTRLALAAADHVIAISEATRQDVLAAYPIRPERITAVPLAADPHFQPQPPATIAALRQKLNLPDNYALYLGINKPHKNLVRLVQAWQTVHAAHPNAVLVIAGAWDPRYPQVRETVTRLGLDTAVHFLGPVDDTDLPALYSGADLFIFPSLYEGFGLPIVEAMACGTAVACSNQSSLPEVGGDAAVYFNPTQVSNMADTIIQLLQDDAQRRQRQQMGLAQASRFTWEKTAVATLAIYRQMIHDY